MVLFLMLCGCTSGPDVRDERVNGRKPAAVVEEAPAPPSPETPVFKIVNQRGHNPFAKITAPLGGEPRALGGYSNGCLFGGVQMPKSGPGFEMVRMSRHRYYAHPYLVSLLTRAGAEMQSMATMLYGDLAQPRGGPMPGGHASHQSGLDADIWFYKFAPKQKMTDRVREHLSGQSVLKTNYRGKNKSKNYTELDPRKWDETFAQQLMWFAGQPETERIFVNVAIKKRLCAQFPNDPRLARLRPWFFHDDHFHLRLKCPAGESGCVPQASADGIECEEKDLAYWFSEEVISKFTTSSPSKPFEANLPLECKGLLFN